MQAAHFDVETGKDVVETVTFDPKRRTYMESWKAHALLGHEVVLREVRKADETYPAGTRAKVLYPGGPWYDLEVEIINGPGLCNGPTICIDECDIERLA